MNLIETEWHQLKTHELAGQIFPDQSDLAIAVKQGIEARAQKGGYETHCFKVPEFPPDHSHIWYFWISKKSKSLIQQGF